MWGITLNYKLVKPSKVLIKRSINKDYFQYLLLYLQVFTLLHTLLSENSENLKICQRTVTPQVEVLKLLKLNLK